jgi:hypothetical protein
VRKQADDVLGVNVRDELLGSLSGPLIEYASPAEGALFFGHTILLRVKDANKLNQALNKLVKGLARLTGLDVRLTKRTCHGIELRELRFHQTGFFIVPTYAIHDGWFALGLFPQPVQGFLLRAKGEVPHWQPDAQIQAALAKLPTRFTSIRMSDPRPAIKQLLSLGPLIAGAIQGFASPGTSIELDAIPNAHEVTRHLFANVAVVTEQGGVFRSESRVSLDLPLDWLGLEGYALVFLALSGLAF